jgi:hypothetical protein
MSATEQRFNTLSDAELYLYSLQGGLPPPEELVVRPLILEAGLPVPNPAWPKARYAIGVVVTDKLMEAALS